MADSASVASSALPPAPGRSRSVAPKAISTLYRFEIFLLVDDPAFDMDAALGAAARSRSSETDARRSSFHGVLATFESVDDLANGTVYRAVLARALAAHAHPAQPRLRERDRAGDPPGGLEGSGARGGRRRLPALGEYPRLPHVCQYRESNFAFLSRRMEREGIYFFFEQGEARERLVVTDDRAHHAAFSEEPVRYVRVSGAGARVAGGLRTFTSKRTTVPGSLRVRDYDYLRPTLRDLRRHFHVRPGGGRPPVRRERLDARGRRAPLPRPDRGARGAARDLPRRRAPPCRCAPVTPSRWRTTRASTAAIW